jgi:hypothetical protein
MQTETPLPVEMHDLINAMTWRDGSVLGSYVDLQTGAVIHLIDPAYSGEPIEAIERALDAEPDRYAAIPTYDREYRLMLQFSEHIDDDEAAVALDVALRGKGAFRSFKDVVGRSGLLDEWREFRQAALMRWAIDWLGQLGYSPDWDLPDPAQPTEEVPRVGLLYLVLLGGDRAIVDGVVTRRIDLQTVGQAKGLFRAVVRDLCELRSEPYSGRYVRQGHFEREGLSVKREDSAVVLSIGVDAGIAALFGLPPTGC